jgi:uncharacterized SAM-binding protein YcdF (DUF218 family)
VANRVLRGSRTCLAALGVVVIVVSVLPVAAWWGRILAGPWNTPQGDVLIVLGGDVEDDGSMGESSYRRSIYAFLAFREGGFHDVLLSGGGNNGYAIADSMKAYLEFRGVPSTALHVERTSMSTRENALNAVPILSHLPGKKVLLTSDYHMTRAYRAFKVAGIDVEPAPCPDAIKRSTSIAKRWAAFLDVVRETGALLYYYARGWV